MDKKAIIIFVRNPVLGEIKTRLAATIGKEKTLAVYKRLLEHTRSITKELPCDKYIFYADKVTGNDIWDNDIYHKTIQWGLDLGQRMFNAFQSLFDRGYEKILIIGSDCYELSQKDLEDAFEKLHEEKILLGPASDGGYYLLGLTEPVSEIFTDIAWSGANVLSETTHRLRRLQHRYVLLPVLNDIDEEKDLPVELLVDVL